ncbi:MAG: hypothetical protein HYU63_08230 [Armatimonadetes bacterium]|nr:hypothetical protein [Armatimonadota bacterium]
MKKKILFVTYGGGHVNLLLPVIIEIKKKSEIESTVLGLSIAGKVLSQYNIDYKGFKDFFDINKDKRVLSYAKALAERWHVPDKEIPLKESMTYLGISMRDLVNSLGEEEAWKRVNELGRKAFLPITALREIILRVKPDLIVATNSPRAERAATLAGKELGISTLNIDDYLEFEPRHTLEADVIAVMCEITRENLIKKGHNPEKIIITGQPAFDKMVTEIKDFSREKIIENLNRKLNFKFTVNDKFILFGTHHLPIMPKVIEAVIKSLSGLRNYYLLIKPHPGEVADFHKETINKYSSSAFFIFLN